MGNRMLFLLKVFVCLGILARILILYASYMRVDRPAAPERST